VSIAPAAVFAAFAACALGGAVAQLAPPPLAPLAHSALLAVDAAPAAGGLVLRVRRATDPTPVVVNDLAVVIDGKSELATARADGSWLVPRPAGAQDAGKAVEVTVGHDGIHEVLSGRLAAAAGASTPAPTGAVSAGAASPSAAPAGAASSGAARLISGSHKQFFWWILNIAIVLIAAIAISRRIS
jgi:hypothetical protein